MCFESSPVDTRWSSFLPRSFNVPFKVLHWKVRVVVQLVLVVQKNQTSFCLKVNALWFFSFCVIWYAKSKYYNKVTDIFHNTSYLSVMHFYARETEKDQTFFFMHGFILTTLVSIVRETVLRLPSRGKMCCLVVVQVAPPDFDYLYGKLKRHCFIFVNMLLLRNPVTVWLAVIFINWALIIFNIIRSGHARLSPPVQIESTQCFRIW